MAALLRFLFVVPLAFVVACLAAGFAMLWPFMETDGGASGDPVFWIQAAFGLLAQTAQVGSTVLIPWAIFMVVTESLGWRSLLLHMAAGIVGGFAVMRTSYGGVLPHASVQTAIVVAGLTFALVYWILAGRSAGRRSRRRGGATQTVETAPKL